MSHDGSAANEGEQAVRIAGATNGISPWRLTTMSWRPSESTVSSAAIDPVGAGGQGGVRQDRFTAGGANRLDDHRVARRDDHGADPGSQRAAQHPDDHRLAADVLQRLAGQALRTHAGGYDDDRVHSGTRARGGGTLPWRKRSSGCASAGSVSETPTQMGRGIAVLRRTRTLRISETKMAELTSNKIIGAGLGMALFFVGLTVGLPIIFKKEPPKHPGYMIAVATDLAGGGAEAADTPPDWGTVLKTADVSAGEAKTQVCKSCHVFDAAGTNNIGPGLWGVEGRKPGSHPGFTYSAGMEAFAAKQPIWDYEHIYEFLKGPQAYIDGTKMTYVGMKNPQDRINVIAYLHTLGSNAADPRAEPEGHGAGRDRSGSRPATRSGRRRRRQADRRSGWNPGNVRRQDAERRRRLGGQHARTAHQLMRKLSRWPSPPCCSPPEWRPPLPRRW